nr:hypothetical protein [Nostoc sp. DedSLP05]MDZ8100866.1 hypothetical protein [Nostoc sp. DedSLP01]
MLHQNYFRLPGHLAILPVLLWQALNWLYVQLRRCDRVFFESHNNTSHIEFYPVCIISLPMPLRLTQVTCDRVGH